MNYSLLKKSLIGVEKSLKFIYKIYRSSLKNNVKTTTIRWILDNYYLIEKETVYAISEAYKTRNLPVICIGKKKMPRVYFLAKKYLNEYENAVTGESVIKFISKVQEKEFLTLTEITCFEYFVRALICVSISQELQINSKNVLLVKNGILSLKYLSSFNFSKIIGECYCLDVLAKDDEVYKKMTSASKAIYREKISILSKKNKTSEEKYIRKLISNSKIQQKHFGFELFKDKETNYKLYFTILLITSLILTSIVCFASNIYIGIFSFILIYEIVKAIIDNIYSKFIKQKPALAIKTDKIEKTVVVVSALVTDSQSIKTLVDKLLSIYFSNYEDNMYIGLLVDFVDSNKKVINSDALLLNQLNNEITTLNDQHKNCFFALARDRIYSKTSNLYIGWEKKRGAIIDFVKFTKSEFSVFSYRYGNTRELVDAKYMVALDADTSLTISSVKKLYQIVKHPLNKPILNKEQTKVISGYALISPKIETDIECSNNSIFSRIFAGFGGAEVYNCPCFEINQTILGNGTFTGKGMIDIDIFYKTLTKTFKTERILSHDLLEGEVLRTRYCSEISFIDGFPSNSFSYYKRLHRWIRGDFQTIPFLFSKIYNEDNIKIKNPLTIISKLKILENLRRSSVSIFALTLIFTFNPIAIILSLISVIANELVVFLRSIFSGKISSFYVRYFAKNNNYLLYLLKESILKIIFLPYTAIISLDAILKTIFRLVFSKKNLLQWTTAQQGDKISNNKIVKYYLVYFIYLLVPFLFLLFGSIILFLFSIISFVLPLFIFILDKKCKAHKINISNDKVNILKQYINDMWLFFDENVTLENNYLPPDNYQEIPKNMLALRTSPTNIGLYLLSVLSAYDFGIITLEQLIKKLDDTISVIKNIEKFKGHLYNWYDISNLSVLEPRYISTVDSGNFISNLIALKAGLSELANSDNISKLVNDIEEIINSTDFSILYNKERKLFYIGITNNKITDSNHYDLLMSEARITSYLTVAKRQVAPSHWHSLSRIFIKDKGYFGLKSWTGTCFEYFMPQLILPNYEGSIIHEALKFAIYSGKKRCNFKLPFGISESCYYDFDKNLNYQYRAFGISKLGLKQGLDLDLVISPYSSFLTMPFDFKDSFRNLAFIKEMGGYGKYGFYEAIDYTTSRINDKFKMVKTYMSHHMGMSIVSINNLLNDNIMIKRFMSNPAMKSANYLLSEKLPVVIGKPSLNNEYNKYNNSQRKKLFPFSNSNEINLAFPQGYLVSSSDISEIILDNGNSFIKYNDLYLTRHRKDYISNPKGIFVLISDGENITYSITSAPFYSKEVKYTTNCYEDNIELKSVYKSIKSKMKIYAKNNTIYRYVEIENLSSNYKEIDVLIYLEPTIQFDETEKSHPAFSSLFIEAQSSDNTIIFKRRKSDNNCEDRYLFCSLSSDDDMDFSIETARENVLIASNGLSNLLNFANINFSGVRSACIDPCYAAKFKMKINANSKKSFCFTISPKNNDDSSDTALSLGQANEPLLKNVIFSLFYKANYSNFRSTIDDISIGKTYLWKYGISGDLPIITLVIKQPEDILLFGDYINVFKILKIAKIKSDFLIIYSEAGEYNRPIYTAIREYIYSVNLSEYLESSNGIILVNSLAEQELDFLISSSELIIGKEIQENILSTLELKKPLAIKCDKILNRFTDDGFLISKNIDLSRSVWCHVLSNRQFGTVLSDSSLGYTYAMNSRENKITAWENDIFIDNYGEKLLVNIDGVIYDICKSGETHFKPYCAIYTATICNLVFTVKVFVPEKLLAKAIIINVINKDSSPHNISICHYTKPVLSSETKNSKYVNVFNVDGTLVIKNTSNSEFAKGFAYCYFSNSNFYTNDEYSFLNGDWNAGIIENNILGRCTVKGESFTMNFEDVYNTVCVLGYANSKKAMTFTIEKLAYFENAVSELEKIKRKYLNSNKIIISTPDESLNNIYNKFLTNSIINCRINARSSFYQSGGAFGFRDQLQDALNISMIRPDLLKIQIIRSAAHQFIEGDVMHWWHELLTVPKKVSKGVRTKCSDDMLWLVLACCEYIKVTGDYSILETNISYLKAPLLSSADHEKYGTPEKSEIRESLLCHLKKIIEYSYKLSEEGLILFRGGDWNDGMNLVGIEEKGASVWLSMFAVLVYEEFLKYCESEYKEILLNRCAELRKNIKSCCFENDRYIRGYYDNGDKLGSIESDECKIDLLPQCFAKIINLDKENDNIALDTAYNILYDKENKIISLFTPPFENTKNNPGYIKGYIKGIRENGGQYTHSAVWFALANFIAGKNDRAYEIISSINPINHTNTYEKRMIYRGEPYYLTADIYTNEEVLGHSGWSIYTGAAGWYYSVITSKLFGIEKIGDTIKIMPNFPCCIDNANVTIKIDGSIINLQFIKDDSKKNSLTLKLNKKVQNHIIYF